MGFLVKFKFKARHAQRRNFAAAIAAALLMFSLPSGAANHVEREYEAAVKSFRTGRLSEAFGQFIDLANRGDVDSARIALFLNAYGQALYGKQWEAGAPDVAYWTMLVRNSGTSARPLPEFQPTVLTPGKAKPRVQSVRRALPEISPVVRD